MMFKNETLVKTVVFTLLFIFISAAHANNGRSRYEDRTSLSERIYDSRCGSAAVRQANEEYCKKLEDATLQQVLGSGGAPCTTDKERQDFVKARDEFIASCKGINMGGPSGNIGCGYAIARCNCQGNEGTSTAQSNGLNCSNSSLPSGIRFDDKGLYDIGAAGRHFANCAIDAGKDLEKLQKELQEQQKAVREMENKISEAEQSLSDAQSKGRDKVQQAQQKMAEASKEHLNERAEALKTRRQAVKQLGDQVIQLQDQISRNNDAQNQITLRKGDALIVREEGIANIKNSCHEHALAIVNKKMETQMANRGNFSRMLRYTGQSERSRWQAEAKVEWSRCLRSDLTRSRISIANAKYNQLIDQANKEIAGIEEKKKALQKQISDIRNGNPCTATSPNAGADGFTASGENTGSATCQAARQAAEDLARADQNYFTQQGLNANSVNAAQADAASDAVAKGTKLAKLTAERDTEVARLNNLRRFLGEKQRNSSGGSIDAKEAGEAISKHSTMVGAAGAFVRCELDKGGDEACKKNFACRQANTYLDLIGQPAREALSLDTPSTPSRPAAPPESAPPNPPTETRDIAR